MKLQSSVKTTKRQFSIALFAMVIFIFGTLSIVSGQTLNAFNPNINQAVNDFAVLPDGKIFIVGNFSQVNGSIRRGIARFNSDGTLDESFPVIDSPSLNDIIVQPDGKLIVSGGFGIIQGQVREDIARLNADGSLDTTFNAGSFPPGNVQPPTLLSDGKILIPAAQSGGVRLSRRNSDGSVDTTFTQQVFTPGTSLGAKVQADGKILAYGFFNTVGFTNRTALVRLNADGTIDNTFDANFSANAILFGLEILPDGKFYVGGNFSSVGGVTRSRFARLNSDGTVDTTFADPQINNTVRRLLVLSSGKVLVAGQFTSIAGVARTQIALLKSDGTLDTSFADLSVNSLINAIAQQPNGKILLGGTFTSILNQPRNFVARISFAGTRFDFDGDRIADLSLFNSGSWGIINSATGSFSSFSFGNASDQLVAADYDGDGKTDIAIRREDPANPGETLFFSSNSSNGAFSSRPFGRTTDISNVVGDWDGDGKDDMAVYRDGSFMGGQSFFFYFPSSNTNGNPRTDFISIPWGAPGDLPIRGDFDGDCKLDAAVFRPSNNVWYILQSSNNQLRAAYWGLSTDKFVPADYDGDGKTDLAVFRNGIWYILQSSTGQPRYEYFGLASDRLVPADYDGDGKADIAVYRDGVWYINGSTSGFSSTTFGTASDKPVPEAN